MKRGFSSIMAKALVCALCLGLLPVQALAAEGLDNFQKTEQYTSGTFTDVAASSWYVESVENAYELGLVKGSSATTFSPQQNITVGSALALASRLHSIYYTGSADFVQGEPWYQVYVDYCVDNGIITAGQYTDCNANATRRQFASILARALPEKALPAINTIPDGKIPDVAQGAANYNEIYGLYRAGVLTGSDDYGTFAPETAIDRASVAAIVSRMALPQLRRQVELKDKPVAVTGVTLDKSALSISQGDTAQLTAAVTPANATDQTVTWTSSNQAVATVSSAGLVSAVGKGSATITAACGGVKAACAVTVTARALSTEPLYEDSNVKITYLRIEKSRYDSDRAELYLDVQNKTSQKITVQCEAVSLNGYTFNNIVMSDDVSASSTGTVNASIQNYDSSLVSLGSVQTVGGRFRVILGGVGMNSTTTFATFPATNLYTGKTDNTIPAVSGREKLYSDGNVEFYFGRAETYRYSDDGSRIEVYLLVRNKTDKVVKIQNDTVIISGRSYSNTIVSDPILPHSTGYIDVSVKDYAGPAPSSVTTVGGDFRVIDDTGDGGTYIATMGSSSSGGWDDEGGSSTGGSSGGSTGGSTGGNTGTIDMNATYSRYPNVPDFGAMFGVTPMQEKPDGEDTMYVYNLSQIPGGASNRFTVMDLYITMLEGRGFRFSNSQGGLQYGYTYDVYNLGSFPNIQTMVSVGYIYSGSTPVAIAINVMPMN